MTKIFCSTPIGCNCILTFVKKGETWFCHITWQTRSLVSHHIPRRARSGHAAVLLRCAGGKELQLCVGYMKALSATALKQMQASDSPK